MRRILVIATRQIGDVLLTTPLIRAARERWPGSAIDVLGFAGTLAILEGNPDVRSVIEVPARGRGHRGQALELARRLWRRYDLALVAQASDRAHLYGWIAAPLRAGLVDPNVLHSWWKRRLLAHSVTVAGDLGSTHVVEEKLALLGPWLERLPLTAGPRWAIVPPAPRPLPADLENQIGADAVVVHVPSMWRYKAWPVEHFRELIVALLADGHQVVLTGGESEADRATVTALGDLGAAPQLIDACGRLGFGELATLLRRVRLYIGPDTSVTHLAAALSVPVIALFGPTNPMRWGPLGGRSQPTATPYSMHSTLAQRRGTVVLLQGPGACVPCGRAGCEDHRQSRSDCLTALAPSTVIAEARSLLRAG